MPTNPAPLASEIWFERIAMIADGALPGIEQSLRHAFHLQQIAPLTLRSTIRTPISEAAFEAMLASEDFAAAARNLVARPLLLEVQANRSGSQSTATIGCPLLRGAAQGRGSTEAAAILNAWTKCMLMVGAQGERDRQQLNSREIR